MRSPRTSARGDEQRGRQGTGGAAPRAGARGGWRLALFVSCALAVTTSLPLGAQAGAEGRQTALSRALDREGEGKCREAIPLYREAIRAAEDPVGALLGLERCYAQVGGGAELLPLLDTILVARPRDPTVRTVHLRTLVGLRRDAEAEQAFLQWVAFSPREAAPYREFARLLLDQGRAAAADTVLQEAVRAIGGTRDVAAEFAQMQAALGMWRASATSWREATETLPYLEQAAAFALYATPDSLRDAVRRTFAAPPVTLGARRVLALLETRWRSSREGWSVLAALPPNDSTLAAWQAFAAEAEQQEAWLTARDAYAAIHARRPADRTIVLKAATAAMNGGEPASALALLAPLRGGAESATVTLLEVRALSALGQPAEIERLLGARGTSLDEEGRRAAQRALAWAWIRAGDLDKAKTSLVAAGGGTDEDERVEAWLALYEGDLRTARGGLRRTDETSRDVVTAMALLSRTRVEFAPPVGAAFLALARGDTAGASRRFESAADSVQDATSFLLGVAARLAVAGGDTARATTLWKRIVGEYAESPEAAEAELDWARALRRQGDVAGAIQHLENMILSHPQSALVPQARRELELARAGSPPA